MTEAELAALLERLDNRKSTQPNDPLIDDISNLLAWIADLEAALAEA